MALPHISDDPSDHISDASGKTSLLAAAAERLLDEPAAAQGRIRVLYFRHLPLHFPRAVSGSGWWRKE